MMSKKLTLLHISQPGRRQSFCSSAIDEFNSSPPRPLRCICHGGSYRSAFPLGRLIPLPRRASGSASFQSPDGTGTASCCVSWQGTVLRFSHFLCAALAASLRLSCFRSISSVLSFRGRRQRRAARLHRAADVGRHYRAQRHARGRRTPAIDVAVLAAELASTAMRVDRMIGGRGEGRLERRGEHLARDRRGGGAALAGADEHHRDGHLGPGRRRERDEPGVGVRGSDAASAVGTSSAVPVLPATSTPGSAAATPVPPRTTSTIMSRTWRGDARVTTRRRRTRSRCAPAAARARTPRLAIVAPTLAIPSAVARSRSWPIALAPTARSSLRSCGIVLALGARDRQLLVEAERLGVADEPLRAEPRAERRRRPSCTSARTTS